MKITIESTTKIVHVDGVAARIWEGTTESGISVHCFVTRIAADATAEQSQFESELKVCRQPSPEVEEAYPARMLL
jgi:hypothetical protein